MIFQADQPSIEFVGFQEGVHWQMCTHADTCVKRNTKTQKSSYYAPLDITNGSEVPFAGAAALLVLNPSP
jgi:hypothetical protein